MSHRDSASRHEDLNGSHETAHIDRRVYLSLLAFVCMTPMLGGCLFLARLLVGARLGGAMLRGATVRAPIAGRLASLGRPAAIAHSARLYPHLQNKQSITVLRNLGTNQNSDQQRIASIERQDEILMLRNSSSADILSSRRVHSNIRHRSRLDDIEVGVSKYNDRWDEAGHYPTDSRRAIGYDQIREDSVVHYNARSDEIGRSTITIADANSIGTIDSPDGLAEEMEYYNRHPAICNTAVREALDKFRQAQESCLSGKAKDACAIQSVLEDNYNDLLKSSSSCP